MSSRITINSTQKPRVCPSCRTPNDIADNGTTWKCQECGHTIDKMLLNNTDQMQQPEKQVGEGASIINTPRRINPTPRRIAYARRNLWQRIPLAAVLAAVAGLVCVVGLGMFNGWFGGNEENTSAAQTSALIDDTQPSSHSLPQISTVMASTPEPPPPTDPPVYEPFTGYRSANYEGGYYDGYWVNDIPNGFGTFTWSDDAVYEGDFVDGDFNGSGKITWPDGSWYEGEWKNDERTGSGLYVQESGELLYNNIEYPWFYGSSTGLLSVEVELSVPCTVLLMDEENFLKYLNDQEYSYYGGDYDTGTVTLSVQGEQRFYLSVASDISGTYSYKHFRDNKAIIPSSGEVHFNDYDYPWFYGSTTGLLNVEIDISVPCTVILLDEENFFKYLNGQGYTYYGGDYSTGTVTLSVQGEQRFYLSVTSEISGTYSYSYHRY